MTTQRRNGDIESVLQARENQADRNYQNDTLIDKLQIGTINWNWKNPNASEADTNKVH